MPESQGGGRKAKADRRVFEAIVFVLRTGCQWKALTKTEFGSGSTIHKRFQEWGKRHLSTVIELSESEGQDGVHLG